MEISGIWSGLMFRTGLLYKHNSLDFIAQKSMLMLHKYELLNGVISSIDNVNDVWLRKEGANNLHILNAHINQSELFLEIKSVPWFGMLKNNERRYFNLSKEKIIKFDNGILELIYVKVQKRVDSFQIDWLAG